MIVQILDQQGLERVLSIVNPHREKCMYLYCNLMKYGLSEPNFQVYAHEPSFSVYGCYYGDSLHVLSMDDDNEHTP